MSSARQQICALHTLRISASAAPREGFMACQAKFAQSYTGPRTNTLSSQTDWTALHTTRLGG